MADTPTKSSSAEPNTPETATPFAAPSDSASLIDIIPPEVHAGRMTSNDGPAAETATLADAEDVAETVMQPEPEVPPVTAPPTATAAPTSQPGVLPLVFGGLLAGVLGFGISAFTLPQPDSGIAADVAAQEQAIKRLDARISDIPTVDLTGIETAQTALHADVAALTSALEAGLTALEQSVQGLDARLTTLEELPVSEDGSVDLAVAAYEADLAALRDQIAQMATAAQAELQEARSAAAAIEANAAAAARNAAARAALARVSTAAESGAPIGAALNDLQAATGTAAPAALNDVRDGLPTLAALQDQFPELARASLAAARSAGVAGEETTGLGAFLRNQFDVRSTAPREGDDADAVLSRAEAAMRAGRLADALTELENLPDPALAPLQDWLALAKTRADALAAIDTLSSTLSDN